MATLHILEHPLIQHKLAILRNENTSVKEFRELVGEVSALMCYEATRSLPTEEVEVKTPVGRGQGPGPGGKEAGHRPDSSGRGWHGGCHDRPDPLRQGGPYRPVPGSRHPPARQVLLQAAP